MLSKINIELKVHCVAYTHTHTVGKGYLFLKTWDGTGESSVRKLLYALLDLKMGAALKVLREDEKLSGAFTLYGCTFMSTAVCGSHFPVWCTITLGTKGGSYQ